MHSSPTLLKTIVAKNLFNANFQKLMVFAGSDFKSILGEYISDLEESLPPILLQNGRGKGGIGMPQRLDGGPLPKESSLLYKSIFQSKETPSSNSSSSSASCPPPRLVYSSSGSGCEDDENSSVSSYGSSIISSTTISKPVPILSEAMIPCTTTVTTTSVRSGSNVRCQRLMGGSFKILCD